VAFKFQNFAAGGNNGNSYAPRIHSYKTDDVLADIDNAQYFNDAWQHLRKTDLIYVCVVTNLDAANEAVADAAFLVVNNVTKGAVDCSDVTDIVVSDGG
jgi:hypothetical protein